MKSCYISDMVTYGFNLSAFIWTLISSCALNDRAEEEIITGVCIVISVCSLTHYNQTPHFREYDRVNSSETLVLTSPRDIPFSGSTSRTSPAKWRHDYLTSFFFSFFLLLFFFSFSTFPQRFWILKQPYTPGMMARWGSSAWRHMMLFLIAYVLIQSTRACVCVSYQLWWYEEIIYIYIFYIGWRCWCTEKKTQLIGNTWCKYRNELWTAQLLRFAKKKEKKEKKGYCALRQLSGDIGELRSDWLEAPCCYGDGRGGTVALLCGVICVRADGGSSCWSFDTVATAEKRQLHETHRSCGVRNDLSMHECKSVSFSLNNPINVWERAELKNIYITGL